jgi:dephospho-CoA kinase
VIGLTGNIGTGKSVVRKMLEHLGALGIDADGLSHAAMSKGAPAYGPVVKTFGEWIVGEDGQINRAALGGIVFANPAALARLESLVHPVVEQAVDLLISRATQPAVVVEAIKLLEGGLGKSVDMVWVVNAPPEVQLARLMRKRKLSEAAARQRIEAQPPQAAKLQRADVVIENNGSFDDTWAQVQAAWRSRIEPILHPGRPPAPAESEPAPPAYGVPGQAARAPAYTTTPLTPEVVLGPISVRRGKPADAARIAGFVTAASNGARQMSRSDVMAAFGEKAYLLVETNGSMVGVAGWQVENLIARVDDLYFLPSVLAPRLLPPLIDAVEARSRELQGEAALVFVPERLTEDVGRVLAGAGYAPHTPESIGVAAWREAILESQPPGTQVMFKRLREDRVLRPV